MNKIRLVHWNHAESGEHAEYLKTFGYEVIHDVPKGPDFFRDLRNNPPDAVIIDLSRLPAQGRDIALGIRHQKTTRYLPLVFVEGKAEKVVRIKEHLPDAVYTTWSIIRTALKRAIAHPPKDPVVPQSRMDGYTGAPLVKKLGIKANSIISLVNAPKGFEKTIGELPEGAALLRRNKGLRDLTIWFTKSAEELESNVKNIAGTVKKGGLWIVWPKKTSSLKTDITQNSVRQVGLASGLVDYKICSIDETWSGLLFTKRNLTQ